MKEIRAYIQPFVLGRLVQTLVEIPGFPGMSVIDCEGFGYHQVEADHDFSPFIHKKRLEIIVEDDLVELIVTTIMKHAHTGRPGDGQVYLYDVISAGYIRTGEWRNI